MLEYGAYVELQNGLFKSALNNSIRLFHGRIKNSMEYASLLLEAGVSPAYKIMVNKEDTEGKLKLIRSIFKLRLMNENLVSEELRLDNESLFRDATFKEDNLAGSCLEELSALRILELEEVHVNTKI